jgi:hypothetical protein
LKGVLERLDGEPCDHLLKLRLLQYHFSTTPHGEGERLLVHTLFEETDAYNSLSDSDRDSIVRERQIGAMASKGAEIKTSAVETHTTVIGNGASYGKSDDDFGLSGSGFGSGNGVGVEDPGRVASRAELAIALQKIEGRKTKWYAYLTTKDFWIVIVLGYVLSLHTV